ncbi:FIST N-terminal domain-containing protein [Fontisphaera persica]|uniref:FIST signal transduction protein n=1 Tax=Fontisphaera persica TaxID=2974023 RepID=UPI0024C07AE6|nr:FIST N-terminal domain-containing protein [Fontisphaera persica]WCJ59219.1 FIST N-terminal domain-containing protein [Fontisphaera persica]
MRNEYSISAYFPGRYEELRLAAWAQELRQQLSRPPTLGLVFLSPDWAEHAGEALELIQVHARVPLLAGCSGMGLIAGSREYEDTPGAVLGLYHLPGATVRGFHLTQSQVLEADNRQYWYAETGIGREQTNGWLAFADPYTLDSETWLKQWNEAYPGLPVVGGLASGVPSLRSTQVYLNNQAFDDGAVVVSLGGEVKLGAVISQGCTPIGEPWTITQSERNFIRQIGNRPAYKVLLDTFHALDLEEQKKARGNLFIGLAMSEYVEQFHRGDFLIRNLLGGDPNSGALAVGAWPRTGQTIQFQRRDAEAATEDMIALLTRAREMWQGHTLYGGCLFACNGRGVGLFGAPDHDANLVQQHLGPLGVSGFFCNGEIGPVGPRNYLHGYTAAVGVFMNLI